jgi:hypothetical protein
MSIEDETIVGTEAAAPAEESCPSSAIKIVTWLSVGLAVAAVGIFVGRELVGRYRFNHRTPYDFYTNNGQQKGAEFGVGI